MSNPGSYAGTETWCKVRGLLDEQRAPRWPSRAAQSGPARSSSQLTQEAKHSHTFLRGEGHGSLPPTQPSLCYQVPHCSRPLLLPRESTVLSSQENAPSLIETLSLYTLLFFAKWITNWEVFQQRLTLPILPETPN